MRKPLLAALAMLMLVSACSAVRSSRLNPFNWFGRSAEVQTIAANGVPQDGRTLVPEVLEMKVEKMPGGAIVRATGRTDTQGWWDGELVEITGEEASEGTLSYRFVVAEPWERTRISTPQSREVTVALFLSDQKLSTVRSIVVNGARNARSSRR